jgi:hypothetical protein
MSAYSSVALTPWARLALTLTEQRIVRQAGISLSGKSPRGPWIAWGPGFPHYGPGDNDKATRWVSDIRTAVNRAAGTELLRGDRNG